jgi:hypothetical protein
MPETHEADQHPHDEHGHGVDILGPMDIQAWGAGVAGILLGLIVALCLVVATGGV